MSQILVVDDSRAIRMILGKQLKQMGFGVAEAANGVEALKQFQTGPDDRFSMAMVDWNMPEMNGLELVKVVRSEARFAGVKLVMVTTETEFEQMSAALAAGADDYIMKPFTAEVIAEKLQLLGMCQ